MPPSWIIEPIDILEDRAFCLTTCVPTVAPDQLCLDGFEERLNHGIVVAISLPTHGNLEPVFNQTFLIVV